ncbi:MAG: efflux RND transporter periplasmic adaptor subunit [Pseudomonadota bacterium]
MTESSPQKTKSSTRSQKNTKDVADSQATETNATGVDAAQVTKKRFRIPLSAIFAVLLALAAGGWIVSGNPEWQQKLGVASAVEETGVEGTSVNTVSAENVTATPSQGSPQDLRERVKIMASQAVREPRIYKVTGQSEISREVVLRAETAAPVEAMLTREGAVVQTGALLAELAEEARMVDIAQAQAELGLREIEYGAANELTSRGYQSTIKKTEADMHLVQAKSTLRRAEIEAERIAIRAPFTGVVEAIYAEPGSYVGRGDEILRLLDLDPILIVAQIPETTIGNLRLGQEVRARLSSGEELRGTLSYIALKGLDETRTFRIEIEIPNPEYRIRAQLTAYLEIPLQTVDVHAVPLSSVGLNTDGVLGIKAVDDDNQVTFYPANIIADDGGTLKLAGLPEMLRIIIAGQEFVSPGDIVKVAE